ncbi:hypothetical protein DNU06_07770 [Putridiphycobacter roseus]|uniref:Uncharacterized protein n=1 Tax=Putridiphycobacter roseus TaxID=2219161 RepID=A0A2W1NSR2_9FLAO|nr:hypothetical protein DNU06_07770 [Putridiphycobacter roseus]
MKAQNNSIKGAVGSYEVTLNIIDVNWDKGNFTGSYQYEGKKGNLTLKGNVYGNCVYMVEYVDDKETGYFYMTFESDSLKGYWVMDKKYYPTYFVFDKESKKQLATRQIKDDHEKVNGKMTGTYSNHYYFVNDWWFSADNPELEIGYNGGTAMITAINKDSIKYAVVVTCSQTYHMAFARGIAVKTAPNKYYGLYNYYEGDSCRIYIEFKDKTVNMRAFGAMSCGFGARAYLNHSFTKTSDHVDFKTLEEDF